MEVKKQHHVWHTQAMNFLCQSLGSGNADALQQAVAHLLHGASVGVRHCLRKGKPERARKMYTILKGHLMHFHLRRVCLLQQMVAPAYYDVVAALLSMTIDLLMLDSVHHPEAVGNNQAQIIMDLLMYLDGSPTHLCEALIQSEMLRTKHEVEVTSLFRRILEEVKGVITNAEQYLKFILVIRLWLKLTSEKDEKRHIRQLACQVTPPVGFWDWFISMSLDEVFAVPKNDHIEKLKKSLLRCKLPPKAFNQACRVMCTVVIPLPKAQNQAEDTSVIVPCPDEELFFIDTRHSLPEYEKTNDSGSSPPHLLQTAIESLLDTPADNVEENMDAHHDSILLPNGTTASTVPPLNSGVDVRDAKKVALNRDGVHAQPPDSQAFSLPLLETEPSSTVIKLFEDIMHLAPGDGKMGLDLESNIKVLHQTESMDNSHHEMTGLTKIEQSGTNLQPVKSKFRVLLHEPQHNKNSNAKHKATKSVCNHAKQDIVKPSPKQHVPRTENEEITKEAGSVDSGLCSDEELGESNCAETVPKTHLSEPTVVVRDSFKDCVDIFKRLPSKHVDKPGKAAKVPGCENTIVTRLRSRNKLKTLPPDKKGRAVKLMKKSSRLRSNEPSSKAAHSKHIGDSQAQSFGTVKQSVVEPVKKTIKDVAPSRSIEDWEHHSKTFYPKATKSSSTSNGNSAASKSLKQHTGTNRQGVRALQPVGNVRRLSRRSLDSKQSTPRKQGKDSKSHSAFNGFVDNNSNGIPEDLSSINIDPSGDVNHAGLECLAKSYMDPKEYGLVAGMVFKQGRHLGDEVKYLKNTDLKDDKPGSLICSQKSFSKRLSNERIQSQKVIGKVSEQQVIDLTHSEQITPQSLGKKHPVADSTTIYNVGEFSGNSGIGPSLPGDSEDAAKIDYLVELFADPKEVNESIGMVYEEATEQAKDMRDRVQLDKKSSLRVDKSGSMSRHYGAVTPCHSKQLTSPDREFIDLLHSMKITTPKKQDKRQPTVKCALGTGSVDGPKSSSSMLLNPGDSNANIETECLMGSVMEPEENDLENKTESKLMTEDSHSSSEVPSNCVVIGPTVKKRPSYPTPTSGKYDLPLLIDLSDSSLESMPSDTAIQASDQLQEMRTTFPSLIHNSLPDLSSQTPFSHCLPFSFRVSGVQSALSMNSHLSKSDANSSLANPSHVNTTNLNGIGSPLDKAVEKDEVEITCQTTVEENDSSSLAVSQTKNYSEPLDGSSKGGLSQATVSDRAMTLVETENRLPTDPGLHSPIQVSSHTKTSRKSQRDYALHPRQVKMLNDATDSQNTSVLRQRERITGRCHARVLLRQLTKEEVNSSTIIPKTGHGLLPCASVEPAKPKEGVRSVTSGIALSLKRSNLQPKRDQFPDLGDEIVAVTANKVGDTLYNVDKAEKPRGEIENVCTSDVFNAPVSMHTVEALAIDTLLASTGMPALTVEKPDSTSQPDLGSDLGPLHGLCDSSKRVLDHFDCLSPTSVEYSLQQKGYQGSDPDALGEIIAETSIDSCEENPLDFSTFLERDPSTGRFCRGGRSHSTRHTIPLTRRRKGNAVTRKKTTKGKTKERIQTNVCHSATELSMPVQSSSSFPSVVNIHINLTPDMMSRAMPSVQPIQFGTSSSLHSMPVLGGQQEIRIILSSPEPSITRTTKSHNRLQPSQTRSTTHLRKRKLEMPATPMVAKPKRTPQLTPENCDSNHGYNLRGRQVATYAESTPPET